MKPATKRDLCAALVGVPDDAPVLMVLHSAPDSLGQPRAGWLGVVRYDPGAHTLDLHDTDANGTSSGPIPVVPAQHTADEDAYPRSCT